MMEPTPVYICTGFLDSGKTLLVKDTLMEQEWIEPGLTLLILCEEGEEEYSKEYLEENDMVLLKIDKFEQLNAAFFTNCEKNYHPAQVVIEYNGMWNLEDLLQLKYPRKWQIQGIYSTVNGTTLDMYLKNICHNKQVLSTDRFVQDTFCFTASKTWAMCIYQIIVLKISCIHW